MSLSKTFKGAASIAARRLAGGALGLGLVCAVALGAPAPSFAQDAAPAPALKPIPQAQGTGPALWVVSDADSTIYLFGTVHVLRPDTAWGSPRLEAAFDSASEIWFEIDNPDDQAAIVPLIQQHGLSPDRPLSHLITTQDLNLLQLASSTVGSSAAQMDPFRPWLAALTLSVAPLVEAGYDPQSGVELTLRARAIHNGQPVKGLETLDEQIRILAGFSEPTQVAFLHATLESFDEAPVALDALVNAWASGDVASIERLGVDEMRNSGAEIYQSMLVRRNQNWAGQIQTMLEGSGVTFIAVGAAHLAGEDGVQEILKDRGVAVAEAAR